MGQLDDRVALITGGESGIGLATADLFVQEGARVHLVGLHEDLLKAAVDRLGAERASASVADVTDEQAVHDAIESGYATHGRLDVLFSNAGISGAVTTIVDYPSEVFAQTLAVHVGGAFHVLKHGLPRLTDGGNVIITSSVVGLIGVPPLSAYAAAKHGSGRADADGRERGSQAPHPVNTLHPGPTSTEFQDAIEMSATGLPQAEAARAFDGMIPLGRHTTPEEIAAAVLTSPPTPAP